jgi:glycerate dehydrogenase
MKITVLDGYTLNPGDLDWRELHSLGECNIYDRTPPDKVWERSQNAEVLITNKTILSAELIDALPKLKYIGVLATGYNVVDIDAARKRHIVVTNIPAYSTESVVQMVFAHILNIALQVQHYSEEVSKGAWTNCIDFSFWDTSLIELAGKKIGIVGLGNIGWRVAQVAIAFGMKVYAYTSKPASQLLPEITKLELDELFSTCDIVSLHCPLTEKTRELVNARRLSLMKPTAIVINTGRGLLVNERDLAEALTNQVIFAAGLDVLSTEPPRPDNPLVGVKNCYITPHIAWASYAARVRLMNIAVGNLKAYIEGKTINDVTSK